MIPRKKRLERKTRLQAKRSSLKRRNRMRQVSKKRKSRVGKLGIVRLVGKRMEQLRRDCFDRDNGWCQIKLVGCSGYSPFYEGHLAHKRTKRNNGDTLDNVLWACPSCHQKSHNCNGKPVPKKPEQQTGLCTRGSGSMRQMTVGSLFAGIGGFDLGFERAGFKTIWQVEINGFCRRVLARHFPDAERFDDVRTFNPPPGTDVICGGFPCQDISQQGAVWGERTGLRGERSGLWWEMLRTVRMVGPRYVIVENVAAILDNGMGDVLGSLAESGYDAEWDCLPACAFGAPHQRDRCFVVANHSSERRQGRWSQPIQEFPPFPWFKDVRSVEDVRARPDLPEPLIRGTSDGIPDWMDRLHALGNAIVPQVTEWLASRILAAEGR